MLPWLRQAALGRSELGIHLVLPLAEGRPSFFPGRVLVADVPLALLLVLRREARALAANDLGLVEVRGGAETGLGVQRERVPASTLMDAIKQPLVRL